MHLHAPHVIAAIVGLAFACQWLAWRTRIPAILFLLACGIGIGPLLRAPEFSSGVDQFARSFVPLAAALILFEGSLETRVRDLERVARPLRGLVTIGLALTWVLTAAFAAWLTPLGLELSILAGAILVVTGPTVIGPLLRHLHLKGSAGRILKFEGTLNDPIGAVLAILTFQVIENRTLDEALSTVAFGILRSGAVALFTGLGGAALLVFALRRRMLPTYLRATGSSALVLAVFTLSDMVQKESGLLAVTIMGVALASQRLVSVVELRRSHEDLEVSLVSILFIVLVSRIPPSSVIEVAPSALAWFAAIVLVGRPVAVLAATVGSNLDLRERLLMSAIAPRGVVAAAISSVFALELAETDLAGRDVFLPLTFAIVALTVAFYGLAARPIARALGVTEPAPRGLAVLGINPFSLALARALKDGGPRVLLLDEDTRAVLRARSEGLEAERADLPSDAEIDRLELGDIGHFLATTSRDEVNALSALQFQPLVENRAYQLLPSTASKGPLPPHLRGHLLTAVPRDELIERCQRGAQVKRTPLTPEFKMTELRDQHPDAVPLFHLDEQDNLQSIHPVEPTARSGTLIALVGGRD